MGFLDRLFGRPQRASPADRVAWESPEAAAFQKVQQGEELLGSGNMQGAQEAFLEGIDIYRRIGDTDGVAYALGRLGDFYHETAQLDNAVAVYQEAITLGTDIPAIYADLMVILAERGEGDQLFGVAEEYYRRSEGKHQQVLELLIRLAADRAPDNESAEQWLLRVERWAEEVGNTSARFAAWGHRAHLYEQAGDIDRAIASCEEAIAAGSSDRLTFTRLLMAYEKAKRWDDLLRIVDRGLAVQQDAAWEEDLRKRLERARVKSGAVPKGAEQMVPTFSVRRGEDDVHLMAQINLSPPVTKLAVSSDGRRVFMSGASRKDGNLVVCDLETETVLWRATANGPSADVFASQDGRYVAVTQEGRIGAGRAEIIFFDAGGCVQASARIPDKLSEVRLAGERLAVGCRDGHLYCYDLTGKLRWRFRVPQRADIDSSDPYQRPCPYFVAGSPEGGHILFSSWDEVFMLDAAGKLLWRWRTTNEDRKFRYTIPLDGRMPTAEYYRTLDIAPSATEEEVRRAFRRRAFETHPDRHPDDPAAADKFKEAVRAYEAITSGAAAVRTGASISFEVSVSLGPNTIYGLVVGPEGERSVVTSRDGHLAFLDHGGHLLHTLVASEGPGIVGASRDLRRIVYAHWGGLNFYSADGLVNVYPADQLYQVAVSEDGERILAWKQRTLLAFDGVGHLIAEIELAKSIGGVAFHGPDELLVAAGKLVRLQIQQR